MKLNLLIVLACCAALTSAKSIETLRCEYIIQNELEMAPTGMWENIQDCATDVVNALLNLGSDITESTNSAVQNVLKFKELVMKCYNEESKTGQLKCVVTNVNEFKNSLSQIFKDTTEIISVLKEKGEILINAIKSCRLHDPAQVFYEIATKVEKCY